MCYLPVDGKTGTLSSGEDFLENSEEVDERILIVVEIDFFYTEVVNMLQKING